MEKEKKIIAGEQRQGVTGSAGDVGSGMPGAMAAAITGVPGRGRRRWVAVALVLLGALFFISPARAATVLSQDWENGLASSTPSGTWTVNGDFWHVQDHPETIGVKSPDINPNLVTLPDSGQLPSAHQGTHVAWFGEPQTGTFCGQDFATVNSGASKNGCTSSQVYQGQLISPSFSLAGASSALLSFWSWWEIEGVAASGFDLMKVAYSIDGGKTWTDAGTLNPASNSSGTAEQSYSNNGLEQSPSWKQYLVDLSGAAGQSNVMIRFDFNTVDTLYNGFRGWLVDSVSVDTPYNLPAPTINSVETCNGQSSLSVWVVHGQNFVENSKVFLDGAEVSGPSIPASDRIEIPAGSGGSHTLQVQSPNGAMSNSLSFSGDCSPAPSPGPSPGNPMQGVLGTSTMGPPPPVFGQSFNAEVTSGTVLVKLPGTTAFVPLTGATQLPLGSIIDATNGVVTITSARDASGATESASVYQGAFQISQTPGGASSAAVRAAAVLPPETVFTLTGPLPTGCRARGARVRAAKRGGNSTPTRHLWGNGKGNFQTVGHLASATVVGTQWLVEDSCAGTKTTVVSGVVSVADFVRHKTVTVNAGQSYLAKAHRRRHRRHR